VRRLSGLGGIRWFGRRAFKWSTPWLTAVTIGFTLLASPIPAAAAPSTAASAQNSVGMKPSHWRIQKSANRDAPSDGLRSISCLSTRFCVAVGSYGGVSGSPVKTLAEMWNGTAWALQDTPNPRGATSTILESVSCTAINACVAVGRYVSATGLLQALALGWNGNRWTIQAALDPEGSAHDLLSAVSCTAENACVAVGTSANRSVTSTATLAEVWNGAAWAISPTPNPKSASGGVLNSVSCWSPYGCIAIGGYTSPSGNTAETLAEVWNGVTWAIQPIPKPSGSISGGLDAVSCTSARACTAVGQYFVGSFVSFTTFSEVWNGHRWSIESTDNLPHASAYLLGVTCTSAHACTAVGQYSPRPNVILTLGEAWNGSSWTIEPTPNPQGTSNSDLSGVSCTAARSCAAVGSAPSGTLAETEGGE
jgi:hypothetical protein